MTQNKGFVLASRPQGGHAREDNFRYFEKELGSLESGQVLMRNHWLSIDPYMRGRMEQGVGYADGQPLDEVMIGGTVGEIVESQNDAFKVGDTVVSMNGGWQLFHVTTGADLQKVDATQVPLRAYLGVLGLTGVTAWYGINKLLEPRAGETVVVSSGTGGVGSVAGQLAKARGARVVAIAGGPEKCKFAIEELGYDAAADHRAADFEKQLADATPKGIDALFENAGGKSFTLCSRRLNPFSRVGICGLAASYEGAEPSLVESLFPVLVNRVMIRGFIMSDHFDVFPQALAELAPLVASGKLKGPEAVVEGIEHAPAALLGQLVGKNLGKQLVKL